jgi:integrase/recombinase XerD
MRLPSVVQQADGRSSMRVQRVLMPGSRFESWTVLGDDHVPVDPVERFLSYLSSIERSPNTVKAYAHDLKDWFTFLAGQDRDWRTATLEDVAGFVAWLRLPPEGRDGRVQVLPSVAHQCAASSVNRKLAALTSFCEFHARHGVALAGLLVTMAPPGRGWSSSATSFRPFLQHITDMSAGLSSRHGWAGLPAGCGETGPDSFPRGVFVFGWRV